MKRSISLIFLLLAMTTYLAHGIVPHHEHGIEICFNKDCCDVAPTCSHEHPDHNSSETHSCLVKAQSIVVQSKENKCSCGTDSMHAHDFILPLFLVSQLLSYEIDQLKVYDAYSTIYASTYILQSNGLRAPPCLI